MAKRENLDPTVGLVFGVKPEEKQVITQEVQHVQDIYENKDVLYNNTQGRKGHKLPRINMAFTPVNHQFIKITSRQLGISATEYVNNLIDEARNKKL